MPYRRSGCCRAQRARAYLEQRSVCTPLPGRHGAFCSRECWLCGGAAVSQSSSSGLRTTTTARRRACRGGGAGRLQTRSSAIEQTARAEPFPMGACVHWAVQPGMSTANTSCRVQWALLQIATLVHP